MRSKVGDGEGIFYAALRCPVTVNIIAFKKNTADKSILSSVCLSVMCVIQVEAFFILFKYKYCKMKICLSMIYKVYS